MLLWSVFVFLTLVRYTDLVINRWRGNHGGWITEIPQPKEQESNEEQSSSGKKVDKKVRFSDEKTVVPGATEPIPS